METWESESELRLSADDFTTGTEAKNWHYFYHRHFRLPIMIIIYFLMMPVKCFFRNGSYIESVWNRVSSVAFRNRTEKRLYPPLLKVTRSDDKLEN